MGRSCRSLRGAPRRHRRPGTGHGTFDIGIAGSEGAPSSSCGCTCSTSSRPCLQHTIDLDVGVPARGLHGEAYRGHVFWDELFIFPLLNYRLPILTGRSSTATVATGVAVGGTLTGTQGPCTRGRAGNGQERRSGST